MGAIAYALQTHTMSPAKVPLGLAARAAKVRSGFGSLEPAAAPAPRPPPRARPPGLPRPGVRPPPAQPHGRQSQTQLVAPLASRASHYFPRQHLASWLLAPHTLTLHMVRSSTSHMLDGGVDSPMHKRCRCLAPWCDGFGGSGCIMRGCSPDHALTGPWTASASPPSAGPPPRRPRPPPPWTASSSPRPSWRRRWPSWRSP